METTLAAPLHPPDHRAGEEEDELLDEDSEDLAEAADLVLLNDEGADQPAPTPTPTTQPQPPGLSPPPKPVAEEPA
jgi:hypothetical protein